jgi:hypothetical protein
MNKKEKKKIKNVNDDIKNRNVFFANQVRIDINPEKARIVFVDDSPQGSSSFEIEMTRKDWLLILEELTAKTIVFLMAYEQKESKELRKLHPSSESMFS